MAGFWIYFTTKTRSPGNCKTWHWKPYGRRGFPGKKLLTCKTWQHFLKTKKVSEDKLRAMPAAAVIQYLTQIKGVGKWTVEMILMFTLQRPDVLPVDDLGIQNAIAGLYGIGEKGKALKEKMVEVAAPWQPYRSYACYYLWRHLDG
jgi:DNA-3-methyladenine glycosylase II